MSKERVAVLGAGSWGTTLANLLAGKGFDVSLWVREPEICSAIKERAENAVFLPGVKLSPNLRPTTSLAAALRGASIVLCVVPSHGIRDVFKEASAHIPEDAILASASKGIEESTGLTASAILKETVKGEREIVVLSGPTFAKEVSEGKPACVCAASGSADASAAVQRAFSTEVFRVYTNTDAVGVELGGALKNVIALAAGISDGLDLGNNARASLITRGLVEMGRLGVRMGARPETFYGLSGLGDLVLTCTGELSRNRTVGVKIGRGRSLEEVVDEMKMVAEGVKTSRAVKELARVHDVEMPITEAVIKVLYGGVSPMDAVMALMTRELKEE
ncbi:MAG: NAD(P)H-dependent glycerol-3-phosphate dehydrogenase [Thermodesulfobacteriota bacterium]